MCFTQAASQSPGGDGQRGLIRLSRRLGVVPAVIVAIAINAIALASLPSVPAVAANAPENSVGDGRKLNEELDDLARNVAAALGNPGFRRMIHAEVSKKFDGTTDALLSHVLADPKVASSVSSEGLSAAQIKKLAADQPRLQISVPVNFNRWNPSDYTPLVAVMPTGVDDLAVKSVTAYDSSGASRQLNLEEVPTVPVIVVGLNERTDSSGKLRKEWSKSNRLTSRTPLSSIDSPASIEGVETRATSEARARYSVDTRLIELNDDNEPWTMGDAEVSVAVKTRGCRGANDYTANWPNLNDSGDAWAPGTLHHFGSTVCPVLVAAWEDDGGAWDFQLTVSGFGMGLGMDNDDDMFGKKELPYDSFKGGGTSRWQKVAFGEDLDIWME